MHESNNALLPLSDQLQILISEYLSMLTEYNETLIIPPKRNLPVHMITFVLQLWCRTERRVPDSSRRGNKGWQWLGCVILGLQEACSLEVCHLRRRPRHRDTGLTFHGANQLGLRIKLGAGLFGSRVEAFGCGHWLDVRWCVLRLEVGQI